LVRNEEEVFGQLATLLAALLDALSSDSERVVLQVRGAPGGTHTMSLRVRARAPNSGLHPENCQGVSGWRGCEGGARRGGQ